MADRSVQELRFHPVGTETQCWLDPEDPTRFTLIRAPSLRGLVGLTFLAVLTLVLGTIALRLGRGSREQDGSISV